MNILILGGTVFVGRGVAEAALARGHRVTLFHRGSKGPGLIEGAEEILGDRDGGLDALNGHPWDAVVDACGYVPRLVGDAARALRGTERYLFVSTVSVYEEDERGGLRVMPVTEAVGTEKIDGKTYGPLKVECEREVQSVFGERATIVRPGLVYGPHDPTGRFPYWADRFSKGGEVLVPEIRNAPLQQIDARDLGRFTVLLLEQAQTGEFDAVGEPSTFGAMIDACHALNPDARPVYATPEALEKAGVVLGKDLPLASYAEGPLMKIVPTVPIRRRPLVETTRDTAEWLRSAESLGGMTREREAEAIATLAA